nr:flagellar hook-basal body complex protein FliE [Occallatibacter savannae]
MSGLSVTTAEFAGSVGLERASLIQLKQSKKTEHLHGDEFGGLLRESIGSVERLEGQARTAVEGLMKGTGVDVHQALIAAEKANAAFELTLSMRNKAVQSYQSIMSMQF